MTEAEIEVARRAREARIGARIWAEGEPAEDGLLVERLHLSPPPGFDG